MCHSVILALCKRKRVWSVTQLPKFCSQKTLLLLLRSSNSPFHQTKRLFLKIMFFFLMYSVPKSCTILNHHHSYNFCVYGFLSPYLSLYHNITYNSLNGKVIYRGGLRIHQKRNKGLSFSFLFRSRLQYKLME